MITFTEPTENAARERARRMRKSRQWADVTRDRRTVTATRLCSDCGAVIGSDAALLAHWGGDHAYAG